MTESATDGRYVLRDLNGKGFSSGIMRTLDYEDFTADWDQNLKKLEARISFYGVDVIESYLSPEAARRLAIDNNLGFSDNSLSRLMYSKENGEKKYSLILEASRPNEIIVKEKSIEFPDFLKYCEDVVFYIEKKRLVLPHPRNSDASLTFEIFGPSSELSKLIILA